jgi:hypothetical protein
VGVETVLKVHMYVYTIQSLPLVGRVDLAAVFLNSKKFQSENLLFSKFILLCYVMKCYVFLDACVYISVLLLLHR